jgi:hypothetical protein
MMQNMVNDARHPVQMSQQEQEMQLAAQERMLRVQEGLAPEAARQAAQLELAKLQAETSVTLNAQNNQAATQQVGQVAQAAAAISQSNAERAAYASGDPVLRAAAATTIEDRPLVDASRLASRLKF